ncbi:MAG TPA: hypothetical protein VFM99_00405 [Chitinophagales bacterium]|nr:hypothetical protein [Chitinophagales bacterium]
MRNNIQTTDDVQAELSRLNILKDKYEISIKDSISELQESLKPINIIKEVIDNAKEKFSDGRSIVDTIKYGFKSLTKKGNFKKGPSAIFKGIASLLVFNIIKGTQGEKKFDWHVFMNGIINDLSNKNDVNGDDD